MSEQYVKVTFDNDGTVSADFTHANKVGINMLLRGMTEALIGLIDRTCEEPRIHNKTITVICEKLNRNRIVPKTADMQGILGTDWLDGKTPDEVVREHREGRA